MATITASESVDVPVDVAYNQWTQFEEFPHFMEGIERVEQVTDNRLRFTGKILGKEEQWEALIVRQEPDRLIAWTSIAGASNGGTVRFTPESHGSTRVDVEFTYEPDSVLEKTGAALGVVQMRVEGDLWRFKKFIEDRGYETGAWRGNLPKLR